MIELKKIDFVVDPLSVSTIQEVLDKAIVQLNELQNNAENKKNDNNYKNYYFGYIFDTRNESKHYIVSNATKDKYSFKSNIVAADDLQQSKSVNNDANNIKNVPDYGFEYISKLPNKIISHTIEDDYLISTIDTNFNQAQITYDMKEYIDPSNHDVSVSGIPQSIISITPYEATVNQKSINTLSIDNDINAWHNLDIIAQSGGNLKKDNIQSTTIMYKKDNKFNISIFTITDSETKETILKSNLTLNMIHMSGLFADNIQSIIFAEDNGDKYNLILLTINVDTLDIVKETVMFNNATAPQTELTITWNKYNVVDALIEFTNPKDFKYKHINILTGNSVFTNNKKIQINGDIISIDYNDYDLNTLSDIDIIPEGKPYSTKISGDYMWFLSSKTSVTPINMITKEKNTEITINNDDGTYFSYAIDDKISIITPVNNYTKTIKIVDINNNTVLTHSGEWASSYGSWPLEKDAVWKDGEKKYYSPKKIYVNVKYYNETQFEIKFNLYYTFWIEYKDANKDTYYKSGCSKTKSIYVNSNGVEESPKTKSTLVNASFELGDTINNYISDSVSIISNDLSDYPSSINSSWKDYLVTENNKIVMQDPKTQNYIVIAGNCTGNFDGYTSEGQTGAVVYDINGEYLSHGPIYGLTNDLLSSVRIINGEITGTIYTIDNNIKNYFIFKYTPEFLTPGEKEKRIKYTYKPQPMDVASFDYTIATGDINPIEINVNLWN